MDESRQRNHIVGSLSSAPSSSPNSTVALHSDRHEEEYDDNGRLNQTLAPSHGNDCSTRYNMARRQHDDTVSGTAVQNTIAQQHGCSKKLSQWLQMVKRTVIVEPVIFLYFLAVMPITPLLQQFVYAEVSRRHGLSPIESQVSCSTNKSDPNYITQQSVQADASEWSMLYATCALLPSIVSTILLGSYTDTVGRKVGLIFPMVGAFCMTFLSLCVVGLQLDYRLIVIGGLLHGISGGNSTLLMASYAYIADTTDTTNRTIRLLYLELAMGSAFGLGSITMGYLIKYTGYAWPLMISEVILVLGLIVTLCHVPDHHTSTEHVKVFSMAQASRIYKIYTKDDTSKRRWKLQFCLFILIFTHMVESGTGDVITYYVLSAPLCFSSVLIGYLTTETVGLKFIGACIFLKTIYPKLGDLRSLVVSSAFGLVAQLIRAFSFTATLMFVGRYPLLKLLHTT